MLLSVCVYICLSKIHHNAPSVLFTRNFVPYGLIKIISLFNS